jgi:hypothetical protein
MSKFAEFISDVDGYFRVNSEDQFPWAMSGTHAVWYALLTVEDGKIVKYGFTSGNNQKAKLRELLIRLEGTESMLLGVWNGQYGTSLFVLDAKIAVAKLS